jgi:uncharacterized protein
VLHDCFVFDCVIHAYNLSDANLLDRADAEIGRGSILKLGLDTRAPNSALGYSSFARDWSDAELWDLVFARSSTDLAMAQTVPIFDWFRDGFAPVAAQHRFAQAHPEQVLFCGGVDPSYHGDAVLEEMHRQVEELGARSFKFYNAHIDDKTWRSDDETVAYPMYVKARELGIKVLQFHKGVPFGNQNMEDLRPNDLQKAARDFPDMTFIIHHLALPYFDECVSIAGRFPNIHLALSGSLGLYFVSPKYFLRLLGQLLAEVGSDKLIWGSEAALMGCPQPYLEAFWDLQIPEDLQEDYGYPAITPEDKRKVLGLNLAQMFDVSLPAKAVP